MKKEAKMMENEDHSEIEDVDFWLMKIEVGFLILTI